MIGRGSGILNHVTSLPSSHGIGDLGPEADRFIHFLAESRQRYWQLLPITAVSSQFAYSPYSGISSFAGNILLISPEMVADCGLIGAGDLKGLQRNEVGPADFRYAKSIRKKILATAYRSSGGNSNQCRYEDFQKKHADWLDDYALFSILKKYFRGRPWHLWPVEFRDRHPETLKKTSSEFKNDLELVKFEQFLFFAQWEQLRERCQKNNIHIIGDLPFYVSHDSADVWSHPDLFLLDSRKRPVMVSGVAPEMFNPAGQRWGHPIFNWEELKERNYAWWIKRLRHNLRFYDLIRLDHFQGFFSYWEIPYRSKTAMPGRDVQGPGKNLFHVLTRSLSLAPVIAEDLGNITAATREAITNLDLPGMKPLIFAFDESLPTNPYAPHSIGNNSIVYTGTHDCNTVRGWFQEDASQEDRRRLFTYLGKRVTEKNVAGEMIRLAMMTTAHTVIFPLQDLLGLGSESRLNRPGTTKGNWSWRFSPEHLTAALAKRLAEMTELFGRA